MARGRKSSLHMVLSPEAPQTLERWQRATTITAGWARRGQIILLLAAGYSQSDVAQLVGVQWPGVHQWAKRCVTEPLDGLDDAPGRGAQGGFSPEVAIHVVRRACERPDTLGRSLSPWDGAELARRLIAEGLIAEISAAMVRRILATPQLKPWRQQLWLRPQHPRDAACYATVAELLDRYIRPLRADARVRSWDEQTSRQPRPRPGPTLPAQPHHRPNRVAHASRRAGALNRCAAFDTRSGKVYGHGYARKRQRECMACLAAVDVAVDEPIRTMHLVCDHVRTPHGQEVSKW